MRVDNQALRKYHSHLHPAQCPPVIAPYHYALRALRSLIRAAGMTVEEFVKAAR